MRLERSLARYFFCPDVKVDPERGGIDEELSLLLVDVHLDFSAMKR